MIAKLEKPQAIEQLDAIFAVADGVMVARGDLGVEMPPEKVPVIQKHVINQSALWRKPVITATQMLESMIENPRPRAPKPAMWPTRSSTAPTRSCFRQKLPAAFIPVKRWP